MLPIVLAMLALMAVGVAAISVSEQSTGADEGLTRAERQIVFGCVGLAAFMIAAAVPYHRLGPMAYVIFGVTLVMLIVVFIPTPLTMPRHGARRWIGVQELSVQPSEIAKISFIILLAWYLRNTDNYRRLRGLAAPFVLTFVPMVLMLKEPDLGTSLLLLPTLFFMLFMAGAKLRHLLGIVGVAGLLIFVPFPRRVSEAMGPVELASRRAVAYWEVRGCDGAAAAGKFIDGGEGRSSRRFILVDGQAQTTVQLPAGIDPGKYIGKEVGVFGSATGGPDGDVIAAERIEVIPRMIIAAAPLAIMELHQLDRIDGWLGQREASLRKSKAHQLYQSLMIIGSGGLTGRSDWNEADLYLQSLPEDHTDFIFAVIGGQWGLAGCLAVLGLYVLILLLGVEVATTTYDAFGRLLAVGVLALMLSQVFINVGMTLGMMPITGMTLPLVSYGGSSLVVNCAALGLLVNVAMRRPILLGRRPFEYGRRGMP